MCTLTFIPKDSGYYLAMNRDERISRGPATPPARIELGDSGAIYPRDTEGGTWIAVNDRGIAFGLLNWNEVATPRAEKTRSRGEVISAMVHFRSHSAALAGLQERILQGIWPFRLVGIFPEEKKIEEWRWDQKSFDFQPLAWESRHWFSSSLSDEKALVHRGSACDASWGQPDAGSIEWLRKLHGRHDEQRGPFSICVHREGVETLSYTEVRCTSDKIRCGYFPGSPCLMTAPEHWVELQRVA